jgi:acyl-CoA reductase-like NAD-dependent aldehyde dehydrogenase
MTVPVNFADRLYIDGEWIVPSSADFYEVKDSVSEEGFLRVASANAQDMDRAIAAARRAFDVGPWPRWSHQKRGEYLREFAHELRRRAGDIGLLWPRETGVLASLVPAFTNSGAGEWEFYADAADTYPFEEERMPTAGGSFGLINRQPVGVVGAIIPWNGPLGSTSHKVAPALLAGCTVVLKAAPQAPGIALLIAEIMDSIGLPPGVFNLVVADREVSEYLVRDPRVDKISFTGSTVAGRRIASICGDRLARVSLELGGKSAAIVLDDADFDQAADSLTAAECLVSGQVCYSLTRIIVPRSRQDEMAEALAARFARVRVGDPYAAETQIGPLASQEQYERVNGYIARGIADGARLVSGGGRPSEFDKGYFVAPTVFSNVDNDDVIAREEIFGPVVSVIPSDSEQDAVRIANDSVYGLNASVYTKDADKALAIARQLRTGTVGQNAMRTDLILGFGGFKQSGIGREGGLEGLRNYLEQQAIILDDRPSSF